MDKRLCKSCKFVETEKCETCVTNSHYENKDGEKYEVQHEQVDEKFTEENLAEPIAVPKTGLNLKMGNRLIFMVRHKFDSLTYQKKINTCLHIIRWAHNELCGCFSDKPFNPMLCSVKEGNAYTFQVKPAYKTLKPEVRVEFLTTIIEWCNYQVQVINAKIVKEANNG